MKRVIVGLIIIVILSLLIVSCGGERNKKSEKAGLNVGFIFVGPIGDGGWNYAHHQGKIEIEDLPFIENVFYREHAYDTETSLIAIEELVKAGAELIFTTSYNQKEATIEMAEKYPHVIFESCSTFIKSDNIGSYFGKIYQGWYLAGVIAGLKTESNEIGMIVAHANPECCRITNAFALGVKKINPDAKVYIEWIHNWFDPSRENIIANKMIDMGCDVIAHNSDSNESQRVADTRYVYSIGYNTDMKDFAPKKNLVSVVWNWGAFYKDAVTKVHKGEWVPDIIWADINSGLFGLTDLSHHIKQKEKDIINDLAELISKQKLIVFSGEIIDNKGILRLGKGSSLSEKDLLTMNWLVDNIVVLNPIASSE